MTPKLSTIVAISATAIACTAASAFAGAMITGAQIKNGTVAGIDIKDASVASVDVRNGSINLADISQTARTALKSAGAQGPAGAQGAAGPRGFSAWEAIPSGQTVIGNFGDTFPDAAAGWHGTTVTLPAMASAPLTSQDINFAPTVIAGDDNAACTGEAVAPTAPAGKVCVYVYSSTGVIANSAIASVGIASRHGFRLRWNTLAGSQHISGSWAYTAA